MKRTEAVQNEKTPLKKKEKTPLDSNLPSQKAGTKLLNIKHGLYRTGRIILAEPKTQKLEPRAMEKPSLESKTGP